MRGGAGKKDEKELPDKEKSRRKPMLKAEQMTSGELLNKLTFFSPRENSTTKPGVCGIISLFFCPIYLAPAQLTPIVLIHLLFSVLVILAESSAVALFICALF